MVKKSFAFRPDHWTYRYSILILVCIIKVSQNAIFDIPAGLEKIIIQTLNIDVSHYAILYSIYSWPNVVFTVIGGILVDRIFGKRLGLFLSMILSAIGQLLMALGGFFDMFWLMIVGRCVIGVGGELALITANAFVAVWFRGKEITFVFALLGTSARLGGASGLYLNQIYYECFNFISDKHTQLGITLLVSFGILVLCSLLTLILMVMDKRGETFFKRISSTKKKFSVKDIKDFGIYYWVALGIAVSYYVALFPFVAIAQLFFISKFELSVSEADIANVVTYATQILAPFFGLMIDWTGFHMSWALTGILLMFGAHVLFLLSNGLFYIPFIANAIIGISNCCFFAVIWATPVFLVKDDQLSTAFGIFGAVLNAGYAVVNLITGEVIDNFGYFAQEVCFLCFLAIGIVLLVLLIFHLAGTENVLNTSGWKRKNKASATNDFQNESNALSTTVEFWKPEEQNLLDEDSDSQTSYDE